MGSELSVTSTVGKGSTFAFTLLLAVIDPVNRALANPVLDLAGYTGPHQIALVVDDGAENRAVLSAMLTLLNFTVIEAANGQAALVQAQACQPKVIFVDLVMPIMDGFTTAAQLRQLPALQDATIVAVSAGAFTLDQTHSLLVGCNAFLPKPIRWEQLTQLLVQYVNLPWHFEPSAIRVNKGANFVPTQPEELWSASLNEAKDALREAALLGDMRAVIDAAQQVAAREPQFAPIAGELERLANDFQEKAIIGLLKECGLIPLRPKYQ